MPRRTFGQMVVDALGAGWFIDRDRDREWVVYLQRTNEVCTVSPPTFRNAEREAKSLGVGAIVLPRVATHHVRNAYNHGRAAGRRESQDSKPGDSEVTP